jgi:hydrogenase expression/formation protein HypE
VRREVKGVCELLGFDPLYLANEGKLVAVVPGHLSEGLLEVMKKDALGKDTAIIGRVVEDHPGRVQLKTGIGGHRLLEPLSGEQFPRIC